MGHIVHLVCFRLARFHLAYLNQISSNQADKMTENCPNVYKLWPYIKILLNSKKQFLAFEEKKYPYKTIQFSPLRSHTDCKILCKQPLSAADVDKFKERIAADYRVHLLGTDPFSKPTHILFDFILIFYMIYFFQNFIW